MEEDCALVRRHRARGGQAVMSLRTDGETVLDIKKGLYTTKPYELYTFTLSEIKDLITSISMGLTCQ